jgi:hypothetical protein
MSSVVISGDTSGAITVAAPAVAGTYTQTLPMITGTLGTLNSGTAVASTSGTSIDFTSLPANIRRITVMFNGASLSGTSSFLVQIGSGSITSSGYNSCSAGCINASPPAVAVSTAGYLIIGDTASDVRSGHMVITLLGSNTYVSSHTLGGDSTRDVCWWGGGSVTLGGALDRVRITTVNGTDTFDAGSINILYE